MFTFLSPLSDVFWCFVVFSSGLLVSDSRGKASTKHQPLLDLRIFGRKNMVCCWNNPANLRGKPRGRILFSCFVFNYWFYFYDVSIIVPVLFPYMSSIISMNVGKQNHKPPIWEWFPIKMCFGSWVLPCFTRINLHHPSRFWPSAPRDHGSDSQSSPRNCGLVVYGDHPICTHVLAFAARISSQLLILICAQDMMHICQGINK